MAGNTPNSGSKKQSNTTYKNTYEAIKSLGTSDAQSVFEQVAGNSREFGNATQGKEKSQKIGGKQEFSVFNFHEHHETAIVKQEIKELTEQIKKEIVYIKKANKSLEAEIKDIEKISIGSLPEKPGIYHVRFLEVILSILRLIKSKVHESSTWLQAMISRKKKRGSLFAARAKKMGTQYSLSEEQKITRQTG